MISNVAALYVDPRGPYPKLVEHWWDEARDARKYEGPWPVVAHPPCGAWGALRHLNKRNDADCGPRAVAQVQRWGGVLEQPKGSRLWAHCNIPEPFAVPSEDEWGFSIEVEQVSWGHVARKKTWLYIVGVEYQLVIDGLRVGGTPTHWASGMRRHPRKGSGGFVPPGIKVCSAPQRRRTPVAFAEWLISLAATAKAQ